MANVVIFCHRFRVCSVVFLTRGLIAFKDPGYHHFYFIIQASPESPKTCYIGNYIY